MGKKRAPSSVRREEQKSRFPSIECQMQRTSSAFPSEASLREMSTARVLVLVLFVSRSMGQMCKTEFPVITGSLKIDKMVHVFFNSWTVNTDAMVLDFPRFKVDSGQLAETVWPKLGIPVVAVYENSTTINFITRAMSSGEFEVSQYSRNKKFIFRAKFLKMFALSSVKFGSKTITLEIKQINSIVRDEEPNDVVIAALVKGCDGNLCQQALTTIKVDSQKGNPRGFEQKPESTGPLPDSMLSLQEWSDTKPYTIIAFYGPFYWSMPFAGIQSKEIRDKFKPLLRMNQHWLGCPQTFCFEGDIDAIVKVLDTNKILMVRGAYHWLLDSFPFVGEPLKPISTPFPGLSTRYIDAGFSSQAKKTTYLFTKDKVLLRTRSNSATKSVIKDISTVFKGLNEKWLDAAFATEEEVYIFKTYYFWVYDIKTLAPKVVQRKLTDLKGLPHTIDAALALSANNFFIFKRSHNFNFNLDLLKKKGPFDSKPSHENLFKCERKYYQYNPDFQRHLNINDYYDFIRFRKLSKPQPMGEGTLPPLTSTTEKTGTESTTKQSESSVQVTSGNKKPSPNRTVLVAVLLLGALVAVFCVAAIGFFALIEKRRIEKSKAEAEAASTGQRGVSIDAVPAPSSDSTSSVTVLFKRSVSSPKVTKNKGGLKEKSPKIVPKKKAQRGALDSAHGSSSTFL